MAQADAGDYLVIAAGEQTQHAERVSMIARFFQDVLVDYDDGVAGKNCFAWVQRDCVRFLLGEAPDIGVRGFIGGALLGNVGSPDGERNSGGG